MGMQPDPKFSVGQRVESFRGELATVHTVEPRTQIGKSHKVGVTWDDPGDGGGPYKDNVHYYEEVFKPHGTMSEDDVKGWAHSLSPEQFGAG